MNEGTRKAILLAIACILIGVLLGAAVFMIIHGDKLK